MAPAALREAFFFLSFASGIQFGHCLAQVSCFHHVPLGRAEFFPSLACGGSFCPFPAQGAWIYSGPAQVRWGMVMEVTLPVTPASHGPAAPPGLGGGLLPQPDVGHWGPWEHWEGLGRAGGAGITGGTGSTGSTGGTGQTGGAHGGLLPRPAAGCWGHWEHWEHWGDWGACEVPMVGSATARYGALGALEGHWEHWERLGVLGGAVGTRGTWGCPWWAPATARCGVLGGTGGTGRDWEGLGVLGALGSLAHPSGGRCGWGWGSRGPRCTPRPP